MLGDDVAGLAPRPTSEFEWEDLLVRLELMVRALPVALEEVDDEDPGVAALLDELLAREVAVARFLERAAGDASATGGGPSAATGLNSDAQDVISQEDRIPRFFRLRRRNFAMVQRRGIDVWDWSASFGAAGSATVYQILSGAVHGDVRVLAAIRASAGMGPTC